MTIETEAAAVDAEVRAITADAREYTAYVMDHRWIWALLTLVFVLGIFVGAHI